MNDTIILGVFIVIGVLVFVRVLIPILFYTISLLMIVFASLSKRKRK